MIVTLRKGILREVTITLDDGKVERATYIARKPLRVRSCDACGAHFVHTDVAGAGADNLGCQLRWEPSSGTNYETFDVCSIGCAGRLVDGDEWREALLRRRGGVDRIAVQPAAARILRVQLCLYPTLTEEQLLARWEDTPLQRYAQAQLYCAEVHSQDDYDVRPRASGSA